METITKVSGNQFSGGKTLFPLAERDFLSNETIFFYSVLLSCNSKSLLKLVETSSMSSMYFL